MQATTIYASHPEEHDRELKDVAGAGQRPFATQRISLCRTVEASKRLIKMLGQVVPVHARIMVSDAYSAPADRAEILRWLGGFTRPPTMTYIVHGEPPAAAAFSDTIARELRWPAAPRTDSALRCDDGRAFHASASSVALTGGPVTA